MQDSLQGEPLTALADVCANASSVQELLDAAVPLLRDLSGADSAAVYRLSGEGDHWVAASSGPTLDPRGFAEIELEHVDTLVDLKVPESWAAAGVTQVAARRRAEDHGYLVLAWSGAVGSREPRDLEVALACLDGGATRLRTMFRYDDLVRRGNKSQQLANMGDYDWNIASDTNRWSDQLFRIYGYEPGGIDPTFDLLVSHIHPDDRDQIRRIHQDACRTGQPFETIERIVRTDGDVRYLSSSGQVILDAAGSPTRMRGTCLDITDQILAERATERSAARFRGLVESSPDAILVLDSDSLILHANHRAHELLEGDPLGRSIHDVVAGPDLAGQGVSATSLAGRKLKLDVTTSSLSQADNEGVQAVFLHDAGVRLANEAVAARLREAKVRRRQALEINDNVVQALSAAVVALEQGDIAASAAQVDRTLAAARQMMNDLLDQLDGEDLQPGDLVRAAPSRATGVAPNGTVPTPRGPANPRAPRILIVDDDEDIRMLVRMKLEAQGGFQVLGEACDGVEAVRMAADLQPDLVLLDLAMPRMDGLQALPLIRDAVAGVRVIVLSGFDAHTMAGRVRAAGADDYLEKGRAIGQLTEVVNGVLSA